MNLSWSQKVFLKINKTIGKRPLLDKVMYFCGQWLIFILAFSAGGALLFDLYQTSSWYSVAIYTLSFIIAFGLSYGAAFVFPHQRPIKELPNIKALIVPLGNWKSFPSDHTIAATLFAFTFVVFDETPFEFLILIGLIAAVAIMFARIYCGVHYPRDIMGGIIFAMIGILVSVLICSRYLFAL